MGWDRVRYVRGAFFKTKRDEGGKKGRREQVISTILNHGQPAWVWTTHALDNFSLHSLTRWRWILSDGCVCSNLALALQGQLSYWSQTPNHHHIRQDPPSPHERVYLHSTTPLSIHQLTITGQITLRIHPPTQPPLNVCTSLFIDSSPCL